MRIIPAIDIIEGKCVRLTKGDYTQKKIYNEKPVNVAKEFEDAGIKYLHLVDLDGAKSKHIVNAKVLEEIANNTDLQIDFGGGIKSDGDIETAFNAGAAQVTAGSITVDEPELFLQWLKKYGPEKLILGADYRKRKIALHGWKDTAEIDIIEFIKQFEQHGISYVVGTDISKDGMLQGASFEIYKEIIAETNVKLIASGGVSSISDLEKLREISCSGAIIGKALYEKKISLKDLIAFSA